MSGGGSNTTTQVSHFEPPPWVTNGPNNWTDYVNRGGQIASNYATNPHLIYGNDGQPMVAQMSDLQNAAANGYYGLASAVPMQAQQQTQQNANNALNGFMYNGGINSSAFAANPYMGDNPHLQAMLDASNNDIITAYKNGTAAQTDAAMARQGAYGGSGYNELTALNNKGLAQALAQNEANVRGQNYYNSGQLAESGLNRATTAQEDQLNRGLQSLGINNQNSAALMQALTGVMGAGDLQQQTQQNNINAAMNRFNANVQQPITAEDLYGSILQRASGQGGSNSVSVPGQSPLMGLLGGALAGYGLLH